MQIVTVSPLGRRSIALVVFTMTGMKVGSVGWVSESCDSHLFWSPDECLPAQLLAQHALVGYWSPMSFVVHCMPENFQTEDNLLFVVTVISFEIDL